MLDVEGRELEGGGLVLFKLFVSATIHFWHRHAIHNRYSSTFILNSKFKKDGVSIYVYIS